MNADAAKAAADAKTSKDVATQKFTADKQRLANKLQNLMTSTQKQQNNNQTRLSQLTMDVNQTSNELAMIGGGSIGINATFKDAVSARSAYELAIKNWGETCRKESDKKSSLSQEYDSVSGTGAK